MNPTKLDSFEARYIRYFAGLIRQGTTSDLIQDYFRKIKFTLALVKEPSIRKQALHDFEHISHFNANLLTRKVTDYIRIADEMDQIADTISAMSEKQDTFRGEIEG